MVRIKSEIAEA